MKYEKALNCFFEINVPRVNELLTDIDVTLDSRGVYSHVFDDLIESKVIIAQFLLIHIIIRLLIIHLEFVCYGERQSNKFNSIES